MPGGSVCVWVGWLCMILLGYKPWESLRMHVCAAFEREVHGN